MNKMYHRSLNRLSRAVGRSIRLSAGWLSNSHVFQSWYGQYPFFIGVQFSSIAAHFYLGFWYVSIYATKEY